MSERPCELGCRVASGTSTVERGGIAADLARESEAAADALTALEAGDADGALAGFEARLRARTDLDRRFARSNWRPCRARAGSRRHAVARTRVRRRIAVAGAQCRFPTALGRRATKARAPTRCSCRSTRRPSFPRALAPRSCCCDLDAGSYPVRLVEDGGTLLLEKLGLGRPQTRSPPPGRRFFRALSSACETVVCERVLNTEDANEAYPSVMFEELLDCYREADAGEDDRATGLPKPLVAFAMLAGEDALHDNLALVCEGVQPRVGKGGATLSWELSAAGAVSPEQRPRIVLPRSPREGLRGADAALALSPSALESYLECPYKWFALRRLRLSEPDAGFGPLEMGSFSHNVLRSFYEHFREAGHCEGGLRDASRSARASRRDVRPPSGIATQPQALGQPVDPAHRLRTRRDGRSEEEARPVPRPRGAAAAGLRARALRVRFRLERAVPVRRMPAARQCGPHRRERGRPGGGYRLQGVAQWRLRAGFGIARRAGGRRGASP